MAAAIEFHDSTLSTIFEAAGEVVVQFRPAYVRVEERGGVGGYVQDVDLRFSAARVVRRPGGMPVWVAEEVVTTESGLSFEAVLPLPFEHQGALAFSGITAESEAFRIEALG